MKTRKYGAAVSMAVLLFLYLSSCFSPNGTDNRFFANGNGQGSGSVFRDTIFVRHTGTPRMDSLVFSVTNPQNPYTLKIQNGPPGYYRIASATIWLNEEIVFAPHDFNPHVAFLEKQVTLKNDNVLRVRLQSKPGAAIKIGGEINTVDTTKPILTIDYPVNNSTIITSRPTITISYSDNESGINLQSLSILVNGNDKTAQFTITPTGAQWAIQDDQALVGGPNTVTAHIADKAGNAGDASSAFIVNLGK